MEHNIYYLVLDDLIFLLQKSSDLNNQEILAAGRVLNEVKKLS